MTTRATHLKNIYRLQNSLNIRTTKNENYGSEHLTQSGMTVDFYRELALELAELLDSTPHKHWKDTDKLEFDYLNMYVENIDILHFFKSILLTLDAQFGIYPADTIGNKVEAWAGEAEEITRSIVINDDHEAQMVNNLTTLYFDAIALITNIRRISLFVGSNEEDAYLKVIGFVDRLAVKLFVIYFLGLTIGKQLPTLDHLINGYYAKYALNIFRNNNGYTDGKYDKAWRYLDASGKEQVTEDNKVVFNNVADLKVADAEGMYHEIACMYIEHLVILYGSTLITDKLKELVGENITAILCDPENTSSVRSILADKNLRFNLENELVEVQASDEHY